MGRRASADETEPETEGGRMRYNRNRASAAQTRAGETRKRSGGSQVRRAATSLPFWSRASWVKETLRSEN